MREATACGEQFGLSEDELAFCYALESNDSAVQVLGDETLRDIAHELVETVRCTVTIDRAIQENTSVNAVVREYLTTYAGADRHRAEACERLLALSVSSKSARGGTTWRR
ncbi:MAG: DUF3387 domain-containing protein [Proteobacteria bacterium]|nr:DUF3387 domain-containing protein [Pseudomonadota bacterium]